MDTNIIYHGHISARKYYQFDTRSMLMALRNSMCRICNKNKRKLGLKDHLNNKSITVNFISWQTVDTQLLPLQYKIIWIYTHQNKYPDSVQKNKKKDDIIHIHLEHCPKHSMSQGQKNQTIVPPNQPKTMNPFVYRTWTANYTPDLTMTTPEMPSCKSPRIFNLRSP